MNLKIHKKLDHKLQFLKMGLFIFQVHGRWTTKFYQCGWNGWPVETPIYLQGEKARPRPASFTAPVARLHWKTKRTERRHLLEITIWEKTSGRPGI